MHLPKTYLEIIHYFTSTSTLYFTLKFYVQGASKCRLTGAAKKYTNCIRQWLNRNCKRKNHILRSGNKVNSARKFRNFKCYKFLASSDIVLHHLTANLFAHA